MTRMTVLLLQQLYRLFVQTRMRRRLCGILHHVFSSLVMAGVLDCRRQRFFCDYRLYISGFIR